jgi:hypothetical protein
MRKVIILVLFALLAAGAVRADEKMRFEVNVEIGAPSILSGPGMKGYPDELWGIKSYSLRLGWAPSKEFQLNAGYSHWEGILQASDPMGQQFANDFNKTRPSNSQVTWSKTTCPGGVPNCSDADKITTKATLDQRDMTFKQMEVGIVRTIALTEKHWEAFVGMSIGLQTSEGTFTWQNYTPPGNDPTVVPLVNAKRTDEFLLSVRGGGRYLFVDWFGLEGNLRWVPIAQMFNNNYNALELNFGAVFKFGKM